MRDTVSVALVGCGDVSTVHFEAIDAIDQAVLVAVCDVDESRRSAAAERYGVPGFADQASMLAALPVDVVHICTPHSEHAELAVAALDAGVAVILEKPLAASTEEGLRIIEAAERSRARIGICFQNRYNAPVRAAKAMLESGELGAVLGASATVLWKRTAAYYLDRPWRGTWSGGGGGLLMNQAIHTVDLLQWMLGEATAVTGGASTRLLGDVIEVEDTADLVIEHRGGARSLLFASLANVVDQPVSIEIVTERAVLQLRGGLTVTYADGTSTSVAEPPAPARGRVYWGVSHEVLIRDFYETLDDPEPFWIAPREAAKSLAIVQRVYDQSFPDRARH